MTNNQTVLVGLSVLSLLFFLGHLVWMIYSLRFAECKETWFENIGKIVPGSAGLLFLFAIWCPNSVIRIFFGILAVFTIILGRAVFEIFVFDILKIKNKTTDNKANSADAKSRAAD
jgi:hypothetical protein